MKTLDPLRPMELISDIAFEQAQMLYGHGDDIDRLTFAVAVLNELTVPQANEVRQALLELEQYHADQIEIQRALEVNSLV